MEEMYYYLPFLSSIRDFLEQGGDVLLLITLLTLVMWTLIFERILYFSQGYVLFKEEVSKIWNRRSDKTSIQAHMVREYLTSIATQKIESNLATIRTCVMLCPLMGLLGTVTGMIQVFEAMALSGSGNPRLMAAGVSKATIPTMAGMVSALSGVAMMSFLQRSVHRQKESVARDLAIVTTEGTR
jgi:biopolymer transport protein ExbB